MSVPLARSIARAEQSEDSVARFAQLSSMNSAELTKALGGDPAQAAPWVRVAAAHGVLEAQVRLGRMLLNGEGVSKDERAAYRWFLRAARDGDADAMNMVGRCHENGWGVDASDKDAADWYRRSAEAGHDWGEYNYAHMLFDGRGDVPLDRRAAFALYLRAAQRGHGRAMNLVGRCLEAGWGVEPDMTMAERWYARSAEAGYFRAQFNHALALLARGDRDGALVWLERAYEAGDEALRDRIAAWAERASMGSWTKCGSRTVA